MGSRKPSQDIAQQQKILGFSEKKGKHQVSYIHSGEFLSLKTNVGHLNRLSGV